MFDGDYGLIFNDNSFWREQRRFALHVLRDFGIGRPILEQTIMEQATGVCEYIKSFNEKPIELSKVLTTAIGNVIYQLAFGQTVDLNSNFIFDFRNKLIETALFFAHPLGFLCELWLPFRYLDPFFGGIYSKTMKRHFEMLDFMNLHVKEHRETINFEGEPRDYIDAFLMEQRKHANNSPEWILQLEPLPFT
uniref:Cytochrome P450 n=1 Tax=Panagrolaimus superbus TaxID=310955 RepID=A0A914ZBK7_9BILA